MAVTRADVARRAGVSPAVVSYVLNPGSRPVSADARRRIEEAIRELGYRPNAIARALRRSATMSIGLLVPDLANPTIAAIAREMEDIAYDHGYVFFIGTVGYDVAREERYIRTYVDRQVDALIVIGTHATPALREVAAEGVPVIVLDRIEPGHGISSVHTEGRDGARLAVQHLVEEHGHERVACVAGPSSTSGVGEDRVDGWRDALAAAGSGQEGDDLLYRGDAFSRQSGYLVGKRLIADGRAQAVFVASDVQAVGVIGAIREAGRRVPDDVAVVSFDNSEVAERAFPTLTSVDSNTHGLAERTLARLVARLDGGDGAETHDVVDTALIIRRSCGCVPA